MSERMSVRQSPDGPWSLGSGSPGGPPPGKPTTPTGAPSAQVQLTRHDKRTFVAQTVHLAGHAFVDCTFDGCTLVLTNSPFAFSGQTRVMRCNWRLEFDILCGAPATRAQLRQIIDVMDSAPETPPPAV